MKWGGSWECVCGRVCAFVDCACMLTQCVFCFCNLDEQHYNSDICVHCLHEPLLSGAMETVVRFTQCTQCDQIICPFHSLPYNLDANICVECDRNCAYTPYNTSDNDFTYTRHMNTMMDADSDRTSTSSDDQWAPDDQCDDVEDVDAEHSDVRESQDAYVDSNPFVMDREDDVPMMISEYEERPVVMVPVQSNIVLGEHTCCICLDSFDACQQVVSLKCHSTHIFHLECITTWISTSPVCPFGCNKQIQKT